MADIFAIAVICIIVMYADRSTVRNMGVAHNGIGAIPAVLAGAAKAPMQFRVLIPWICGALGSYFGRGMGKYPYLNIYLGLRWTAIVFAMFSAYLYLGSVMLVMLLALYFVWAMLYDYTDGYIEVGCYALAFHFLSVGGDIRYTIVPIVTLIATLNRETSVFIPVAAILTGETLMSLMCGAAFVIGYMIPRMVYDGGKRRYCNFFLLKENIKKIKESIGRRPVFYNEYISFFILCAIMGWAYISMFLSSSLTPITISMGGMFLALLIPTIWREIRVFGPVVLAVIPTVGAAL